MTALERLAASNGSQVQNEGSGAVTNQTIYAIVIPSTATISVLKDKNGVDVTDGFISDKATAITGWTMICAPMGNYFSAVTWTTGELTFLFGQG